MKNNIVQSSDSQSEELELPKPLLVNKNKNTRMKKSIEQSPVKILLKPPKLPKLPRHFIDDHSLGFIRYIL